MDFKTFKVTWEDGTSSLIMGTNIADACNVTLGDAVPKVMAKWTEVVFPTEDTLETERFSCAACKGDLQLWMNNQQYRGVCGDCSAGRTTYRWYDDEMQAILAWNRQQLEQTKLMIEQSTALDIP